MHIVDLDAHFALQGLKRDPSRDDPALRKSHRIVYWERLDPYLVVGLPVVEDTVPDAALQYLQRILKEEFM